MHSLRSTFGEVFRLKLGHVKDCKKNAAANDKDAGVNVGDGSIDYTALLPEARKYGLEYFIVEQENYENTTPVAAAKADVDYLKRITF